MANFFGYRFGKRKPRKPTFEKEARALQLRDVDEDYTYSMDEQYKLGAGGEAVVYKGWNKKDGSMVAVKVPNNNSKKSREWEMLSKLNHQNVIRLFARQSQLMGDDIMVLEYCNAGSLHDVLADPENKHGMNDDKFLDIVEQIVSGLRYVIKKNIVHRDIKPGNIMCQRDQLGNMTYKIADFGTAKKMNPNDKFVTILGTPEMMTPQMFDRYVQRKEDKKKQDGANYDLWALGVTLYMLATGEHPFQPFDGCRLNMAGMLDMQKKKPPGTISGIQKEKNGDVTYSNILPADCKLSRFLRSQLEIILAGVFEFDDNERWKCDTFFDAIDTMTSQDRFAIYVPNHGRKYAIYYGREADIEDTIRDQIPDLGLAEFELIFKNQLLPMEAVNRRDDIADEISFLFLTKTGNIDAQFPTVVDIPCPTWFEAESYDDLSLLDDVSELAFAYKEAAVRLHEQAAMFELIFTITMPALKSLNHATKPLQHEVNDVSHNLNKGQERLQQQYNQLKATLEIIVKQRENKAKFTKSLTMLQQNFTQLCGKLQELEKQNETNQSDVTKQHTAMLAINVERYIKTNWNDQGQEALRLRLSTSEIYDEFLSDNRKTLENLNLIERRTHYANRHKLRHNDHELRRILEKSCAKCKELCRLLRPALTKLTENRQKLLTLLKSYKDCQSELSRIDEYFLKLADAIVRDDVKAADCISEPPSTTYATEQRHTKKPETQAYVTAMGPTLDDMIREKNRLREEVMQAFASSPIVTFNTETGNFDST